jgi:hypothetical protein
MPENHVNHGGYRVREAIAVEELGNHETLPEKI